MPLLEYCRARSGWWHPTLWFVRRESEYNLRLKGRRLRVLRLEDQTEVRGTAGVVLQQLALAVQSEPEPERTLHPGQVFPGAANSDLLSRISSAREGSTSVKLAGPVSWWSVEVLVLVVVELAHRTTVSSVGRTVLVSPSANHHFEPLPLAAVHLDAPPRPRQHHMSARHCPHSASSSSSSSISS
jgi:hypothetical protein